MASLIFFFGKLNPATKCTRKNL